MLLIPIFLVSLLGIPVKVKGLKLIPVLLCGLLPPTMLVVVPWGLNLNVLATFSPDPTSETSS